MPRRLCSLALALGLLFTLSLLAGAAAMTSRTLDVQIEVFRPLGILGIGRYVPLDARFLTVEIGSLGADDAAALRQATATCGETATASPECAALATLEQTFLRRYAADPILGSTYRVALTNKTDAPLGVVLSIDGLNTNGGQTATGTAEDRKWVLAPRQTTRIVGWQVSTDQALAFRFETPSRSQGDDPAARGTLRVDVYLPDPSVDGTRGTGAGSVVDQPTVLVPFSSLTSAPVDVFSLSTTRTAVPLGILCGETGGVGVRVTRVLAGTIAELRGLQAGDVITHLNALPVNTCGDLSAALAGKRPGDRVVLKVHREGRDFLVMLEVED